MKRNGHRSLGKISGQGMSTMMQSRFSFLVHSGLRTVWISVTTPHKTEVPGRLAVSDAASVIIHVSWSVESPVLGILVWMILHAIQTQTVEIAFNLSSCILHHTFPGAGACIAYLRRCWVAVCDRVIIEVLQSIKNVPDAIFVDFRIQRPDPDSMQFPHVEKDISCCTIAMSIIDSHVCIFKKRSLKNGSEPPSSCVQLFCFRVKTI